jgi:hypothetical protein
MDVPRPRHKRRDILCWVFELTAAFPRHQRASWYRRQKRSVIRSALLRATWDYPFPGNHQRVGGHRRIGPVSGMSICARPAPPTLADETAVFAAEEKGGDRTSKAPPNPAFGCIRCIPHSEVVVQTTSPPPPNLSTSCF